ncbi:MAG: hypothetical protein LBJ12_03475 [Oscillospiraceae bacterium]|jgi:tRNA(fMet)-specific endonuclease VapC|nr:hypothetical protein [Oscillospiraceae bacterium]
MASIKADLERKGTPIGTNDIAISATTRANGGVMITRNAAEFSRVEGLQFEDWTQ